MPTPKENFIRLMKNDHPTWLGDPWSCFVQNPAFRPCVFDGVTITGGSPMPGDPPKKDRWGITWEWPLGQPGGFPIVNEETKVLKDIRDWREVVNFNNLPPAEAIPWPAMYSMSPTLEADRANLIVMCPSFQGMFEFTHNLMGFEDALVNYLEEPEEMFALLSAYTDWKIKAFDMVIDHVHPDMIHSHDDWGNKKQLFLPPTVWREIIKPHYARFYGHLHDRGIYVQHHNDSVSDVIAKDMVDIGIDMWQGVIPQNDIPGIIEATEGKLCVMGGIDMQKIDFDNANEADVRAQVHEVIDRYMPLGSFIPCVPNIFPIHKDVEAWLNDELNTYGAEYAAKHF